MAEVTTCIGAEQITSLASSAPLAAIPTYATWALLKPRSQGIYLGLLGGTVTSANGMAISADVPVEITSKLSDVRVLQQAGGGAVDVWYFG